MFRFSLSFRLALFWLFTLVVAGSLAFILNGIYRQGAGAQISVATGYTEQACRELQRKYRWGVENDSFGPERETQFQAALVEIILDHYTGVEGGFWKPKSGFVAYAYPTYEGSGTKHDVPEAEKPSIESLAKEALEGATLKTALRRGSREAMVLTACPTEGRGEASVVWTMTRVSLGVGEAYDRFVWGIATLLLFVCLTGIGIPIFLYRWSRNLKALSQSIKDHSIEKLPELPTAAEPELQSIVLSFNELNSRLKTSKAEAAQYARRLAQVERLATLGKLAAGFAHEVRNPLATLRLKLENALVDPAARLPKAAPVITAQIERMDRLIQMLLAMTQPFELRAQEVEVERWLNDLSANLRPRATEKSSRLICASENVRWSFDSFHLARAVENLILNAIAFTPAGGTIELRAGIEDSVLCLTIKDSGPGVSPEIKASLFEPFKTGRTGGTGLGLVLVKEIVEAHGGRIAEIGGAGGACFRMEIPWLRS